MTLARLSARISARARWVAQATGGRVKQEKTPPDPRRQKPPGEEDIPAAKPCGGFIPHGNTKIKEAPVRNCAAHRMSAAMPGRRAPWRGTLRAAPEGGSSRASRIEQRVDDAQHGGLVVELADRLGLGVVIVALDDD